MTVIEAERVFSALVDRVVADGIAIDLERDEQVVARLAPVPPRSPLRVGELNALLQSLPRLGEDAETFDADARELRQLAAPEANPWE